MSHRRSGITQAIVLASLLVGCRGAAQVESWAVGMCAQVGEAGGTAAVACTEPHTHKVIAIAPRAEECPIETDLYASPADPDDGLTPTCFQSDMTTR